MVHGTSNPVCERCQGMLAPDQKGDLLTGMTLVVYRCINCGRRTRLEKEPRPLTPKPRHRDEPVKSTTTLDR